MKRMVSGIMLTLLFIGMVTLAFNIQLVRASGAICIRANGSIDPPTVNITTADNFTYNFTDNNHAEIVVERSNIIIDGGGYELQGNGSGNGFRLQDISNVTIKNMSIRSFTHGVYLTGASSHNNILENNITHNSIHGIYFYGGSMSHNNIFENVIIENDRSGIYFQGAYPSCQNNNISANNISNNTGYGIHLGNDCFYNTISENAIANNAGGGIDFCYGSGFDTISGNNITRNSHEGINLQVSSNHIVSGNTIIGSDSGIVLNQSPGNTIYHNNFVSNTVQAYVGTNSSSAWDDGYPNSGNYWSDYSGADVYRGRSQNVTGSDGIGDTPHNISVPQKDNYPLIDPWTPGWKPKMHDVAVTDLAPSKTTVSPGETIQVCVEVWNLGNFTETFNLTLSVVGGSTIGTRNITLAPGEVSIETFNWTAPTTPGSYVIRAEASVVAGEYNTENNWQQTSITVTSSGGGGGGGRPPTLLSPGEG